MNKYYRISFIFLLLGYGALCFIAGYQLRDNVIPALQSRVNASIDYREFPSVEAYQEWGAQQPLLGEWTLILTDNRTTANYSVNPDCDKQAEYLQRRALNDGYLVSQAIVNKNGYIANTYVADTKGQYHVGLITAIGNQWEYMDSFTREIVRIQLVRD